MWHNQVTSVTILATRNFVRDVESGVVWRMKVLLPGCSIWAFRPFRDLRLFQPWLFNAIAFGLRACVYRVLLGPFRSLPQLLLPCPSYSAYWLVGHSATLTVPDSACIERVDGKKRRAERSAVTMKVDKQQDLRRARQTVDRVLTAL